MKYILYCAWALIFFSASDLEGQKLEVDISGQIKHSLSEDEIKGVQSVSTKLLNEYLEDGDLIDPVQMRITNKSIQDFKGLFDSESSIIIDFMNSNPIHSVERYIQWARTYYEKEGVPFDIENPELIKAIYEDDCACYRAHINLIKVMHHYYDRESWYYDKKDLLLEFELTVNKDFTNYKISSIRKGTKLQLPQFSQHTLSLFGGTSIVRGTQVQGVKVSSPYSLGLSYQYIKPLNFLNQSISFVVGAQLRYSQINTTVSEGVHLTIDENSIDNSVIRMNFLTDGVENMSVISIEPQIGLDIQFMENQNSHLGIMALVSPRFSLSASAGYTGALAYEETFNERVTVRNIINCGLRDFSGADAIDASYSADIIQTGLGVLLSPYYQWASGDRRGWRLGMDIQYYYLTNIYKSDEPFLGNYNEANNSGTSGNPSPNLDGGSLLQSVSEGSSEWYIGFRVGYYLSSS